MILVTVVMLTSFVSIYIYTANSLRESSFESMSNIAQKDFNRFDSLFGDKSVSANLPAFIIDLDEVNYTCTIKGYTDYGTELTDDQTVYINGIIRSVLNSEESEGVLEEYDLLYYCYYQVGAPGRRIVLLDKSYEDENLRNLVVSFLLIGVASFAAFLVISIILARVSVKPVEKSLRQQKQLVSDMSHELKTPITVINTNTDIILSHSDSTVQDERKWVEYIKDETVRMTDLVNNMLYLAKSDEKAKSVLTETDLSKTVYGAALPFESICFENGKSFDISIVDGVSVLGDEQLLKQLAVILLDNANKYSNDHGNIRISVYNDADRAYISVYNTGKPIPKESIPHLFERFYRVDESRSRVKGGSGLGLSIAQRIIEQHEGSISVHSSYENGTEFLCTFKLLKKKQKNTPQTPTNDLHFDDFS